MDIVVTFQLSEEGPCEDLDGDSQLSSFSEWMLPAKEFDGMWDRLEYITYLNLHCIVVWFMAKKWHNSAA